LAVFQRQQMLSGDWAGAYVVAAIKADPRSRKPRTVSRGSRYRASASVEMLSDNGSPYIARETRIFAAQLGLKPCFTPVKSPQSNGISEAFVNTLKRDYVRVTPIPNAEIAMQAIAGWFEDYNENHPHSGLKMRSPREVRSAQIATA
jgi:putative transposase